MPSISRTRKKAPHARTDPGPKPLEAFVSSGIFSHIQQRRDWLRALQAAWQQFAGLPLASHTRPVSYRSGRLSVHADGSIWADRVRQQHDRLMQTLRQDPMFESLMQLSVRVVPPETAIPAAKRRGVRLSATSATLISNTASTIDDPELRAALQRLGSRGKQRR